MPHCPTGPLAHWPTGPLDVHSPLIYKVDVRDGDFPKRNSLWFCTSNVWQSIHPSINQSFNHWISCFFLVLHCHGMSQQIPKTMELHNFSLKFNLPMEGSHVLMHCRWDSWLERFVEPPPNITLRLLEERWQKFDFRQEIGIFSFHHFIFDFFGLCFKNGNHMAKSKFHNKQIYTHRVVLRGNREGTL